MRKCAAITALALAFASANAVAQSPIPPENTSPAGETETEGSKTWYVMIAVEQALGPRGCRNWRYKVSTAEPIVIQGPPEIRPNHGDEIAAWWMVYLRQRSPSAYGWLTGPDGHNKPEVYFRETAEEVMHDFRIDGHLIRSRSCVGSVLVTHGTSKFRFIPPYGFASVDFGNEPVPTNTTVASNIPKIPGIE